MMPTVVIIEIVSGIIALLFAGAAFTNLTWAEGASSQAMKRESAWKTKRLFVVAGFFAAVCGVCAYLSMR